MRFVARAVPASIDQDELVVAQGLHIASEIPTFQVPCESMVKHEDGALAFDFVVDTDATIIGERHTVLQQLRGLRGSLFDALS